jgi:hypothetical protein
MQPELRRIVAVEAHRRRSGRYPVRVHSLGTGETFEIAPSATGFVDVASGTNVKSSGTQMVLSDGLGPIDLRLVGDVFFEGREHSSGESFTGRAGGGASVTLYSLSQDEYFQYAIGTEDDRI